MHNRYFMPFATLISVFFGAASGCGTAATDTSILQGNTPQATRLEHHQAAHHPGTYAAAVNQLERCDMRLQAEAGHAASADVKRELKEVLDILEWLPSIAADSDLKKSDWEQVKHSATQLTGFYQSSAAAVNAGGRPQNGTRDECRRAIESLRGLVPAADQRL
ncbi:MAG: hypothetical protein V4719_03180 [Planctomycetota bacterium]